MAKKGFGIGLLAVLAAVLALAYYLYTSGIFREGASANPFTRVGEAAAAAATKAEEHGLARELDGQAAATRKKDTEILSQHKDAVPREFHKLGLACADGSLVPPPPARCPPCVGSWCGDCPPPCVRTPGCCDALGWTGGLLGGLR